MNTGRTLESLAQELARRRTATRDYLAPQGRVTPVLLDPSPDPDPSALAPDLALAIEGNGGPMPLTPLAHRQLGEHLGIPAKYYDRMRTEKPALLLENLTAWLREAPSDSRLIRTLDGQVRAILSPKYRPLDNWDLCEAVLPTLQTRGVQIVSCELTETRLYIKGILPTLSDEAPEGTAWGTGHAPVRTPEGRNRIVAAIVISNSEVGAGSVRVEPSVFTTFCTNLAILAEAAMRKYHIGRGWAESEEAREVFADETRQADNAAFWLKVRDVTRAAFSEDGFRAAIASIREASGRPIEARADLPGVVEATVRALALPEAAGPSILGHLAGGGDLSAWGLSSALTAAAGDPGADYETSTQLERAGGRVLALPPRDWARIAAAQTAA